jgi:holin (3TMs family)
MNLLKLLFDGMASPITTPLNVIDEILKLGDKIFTNQDEKKQFNALIQKIAEHPLASDGPSDKGQIDVNLKEAENHSLFVSGWRPFIGWICGISLAFYFIPQYIMGAYLWSVMCLHEHKLLAFPISDNDLLELLGILLGIGVYGFAKNSILKILQKK